MKGNWKTWKTKAIDFLGKGEHQIVIPWIPFFRSVFKFRKQNQGVDSDRKVEERWRELEEKVNNIQDSVLMLQSASKTYRGDLGKDQAPPSDLGSEGDLYESIDGRRFIKGPPFWETKPGTYGVLARTTVDVQQDDKGRMIVPLRVDIGGKVCDLGTLTIIPPSTFQVAWQNRLGFDPELRELRDALFSRDLAFAIRTPAGEEFVQNIPPPPKGHPLYRGAPIDKWPISSDFSGKFGTDIPFQTEIPFYLGSLRLGEVFVNNTEEKKVEIRWSVALPFEVLSQRKEILGQHVLEYDKGRFVLSRAM